MTKHLLLLAFVVSLFSANTAYSQQGNGLSGSYSVSVGYINTSSGSHGDLLPDHVSNVLTKGMYIRYGFEYGKIINPFMFISYNRSYDDSVTPITPQLWNLFGGFKFRNFYSKKLPLYTTILVGIENAKLRIKDDSYLLQRADQNAVVGLEVGIKYPIESFVSGDIGVGMRKPFTSLYKGIDVHFRLGISFDFSKR